MTLTAENIVMQFGGVEALSDVSITIEQGLTTALIGSNGAGKSTLINCFTGLLKPTRGKILLEGQDITSRSPEARVMDGLSRSFQRPRVDQAATVRENVMIGYYAQTKSRLIRTLVRSPKQRAEERNILHSVDEILIQFGLESVAEKRAGDLPVWQLRIIEIARSATMKPKYMLLDEPAAGLDASERAHLGTHIQALAAANIGVLLVEHNFSFIREMSDHVVVIDRGRPLAEGSIEQIENNPAVIASYLKGGIDDSDE